MANVYNQYSHPYVGIWVFWRPGLIVNCPNLAHNILVKDSDNFRNRLLGTGTRDKMGTLNMFTVNVSDTEINFDSVAYLHRISSCFLVLNKYLKC